MFDARYYANFAALIASVIGGVMSENATTSMPKFSPNQARIYSTLMIVPPSDVLLKNINVKMATNNVFVMTPRAVDTRCIACLAPISFAFFALSALLIST
jgi:hypothetical protein